MTNLVTRCPKCATSFRLTSNQLESARGSVRCGSCLHIFKAQDHLAAGNPGTNIAASSVVTTAKSSTATKSTGAAKTAGHTESASPTKTTSGNEKVATKRVSIPTPINRAKVFEDEEDSLISDDMDKPTAKESTYEFDGFLDVNLQPKQNASLFDREIRYQAPLEEKEHVDESWADNLLDSEDTPKKPSRAHAHSPQSSRSSQQDTKPHDEHKQAPVSAQKNEADSIHSVQGQKPPVFSIVSESNPNEDEDEFSEAFMNATRTSTTNSSSEEERPAGFSTDLFTGEEEFGASQATKKLIKNAPKIHAANPSRAALLMNIMPAPIEFTAKRMRTWYQRQLWFALSLLAVIALLFQVAYFKFSYFSRVEPYRSAYAILCPFFNCKVPSLVDTSQISANNLVVRLHPQQKNALLVDAIILNKAPFEQPFPDLILAFSTVDDVPVASRRFTPKEYLGGELAGMHHIPISQPVHITLELADPGPDAVNYHMNIAQ